MAQTVSGTARNDKGAALPNVPVNVKGASTGTLPGEIGKFTIAARTGNMIVSSYIGISQQELKKTLRLFDNRFAKVYY